MKINPGFVLPASLALMSCHVIFAEGAKPNIILILTDDMGYSRCRIGFLLMVRIKAMFCQESHLMRSEHFFGNMAATILPTDILQEMTEVQISQNVKGKGSY